nr:hypothetical protein [Tanacetum cinerariifolium]
MLSRVMSTPAPYVTDRHAYLVDMDYESEPFENVRGTEELQPLAVRIAPPTSDHTPTSFEPTPVPPLRKGI